MPKVKTRDKAAGTEYINPHLVEYIEQTAMRTPAGTEVACVVHMVSGRSYDIVGTLDSVMSLLKVP